MSWLEKLLPPKILHTDPADRRRKLLHLTASGKKTYRAIIPLAQGFEKWMLSELPASQRKNLIAALRKLCERLQLTA